MTDTIEGNGDATAGTPAHNLAVDLLAEVELCNKDGDRLTVHVEAGLTPATTGARAEYAAWAQTGDDTWAAAS